MSVLLWICVGAFVSLVTLIGLLCAAARDVGTDPIE